MNFSLLFMIILLFPLVSSGTPTYCIDLFYDNMNSITTFETELETYCIDYLVSQGYSQNTAGCLTCKIRVINGLFEIPETQSVSSLCITPSTVSCSAGDYSGMQSLVSSFVNTIKTTELILSHVTSAFNLNLQNQNTIEEQAPPTNNLIYTPKKQTSSSLTYELTNKNTFPIKCYKLLSSNERSAVKGDLSFILKASSSNVFTESFSAGHYDCKSYKLRVTCYSVPYIENAYLKTEKILTSFTNNPPSGGCPKPTFGEVDEPDPPEEITESGSSAATVIIIIVVILILGGVAFYFFRCRRKEKFSTHSSKKIGDYVKIFDKK